MGEKFFGICNKSIEYSFYALFLIVPLTFTSLTYELFEFNKMWLTFGLTIVIVAAWIIKMILQKRILFQRTPLDLPILLFLLSQIVSTILSLDPHVSVWGYYSRFNGGLLSIISYILLYYAFVSNFSIQHVKRLLLISLISGAIVALWGLPSHFGYDPTCLVLRGTFDVSCWTESFQPKVRIFSTLGQPNWLAAYLAILIPIAIAFGLQMYQKRKLPLIPLIPLVLLILFYLDLLFSNSQSGFLGLIAGLAFITYAYFLFSRTKKWYRSELLPVLAAFVLIAFFVGQPIAQLNKFTFPQLKNQFLSTKQASLPPPQTFAGELGGTDSSKIRLIVWKGALDAWKHNPLFGTGVETFAFAYYKYRPVEHNVTSEWDYLYNKAHNEYLNFLATTGIVGLATYLVMIATFLLISIQYIVSSIKNTTLNTKYLILNTGLLAGYLSILVSNFFGFSTVVINIYFFLIPAFVFILSGQLNTRSNLVKVKEPKPVQLVAISLLLLIAFLLLLTLFRFWKADVSYASGYNLDRASEYQLAYPQLYNAVILREDEPSFQDELAYNSAILAVAFASDQDATMSSTFATQAKQTSDLVVSEHPNNIVFWKTRVRIFYALSQIDEDYNKESLKALEKIVELAPTDAKTLYNLGLVYGQNDPPVGGPQKAIEILEKTITLKPNYQDAYYALGLFYRELATDDKGNVIDATFQRKAVEQMKYILKNLSSKDEQATKALQSWGELP